MLDQTGAEVAAITTTDGQNIDEGKLTAKQVYARARSLGTQEGKGDNSRPGVFLLTVEAAKLRAIGKDDVKTIFDEYSRSSAAARGVGWKRQDSEKQQVSKLAVAVRLGELPHVDGMALMNKVIAFQKEERIAKDGKMDYSPFDGMVVVARYQVNKSPGTLLPDDVIRGLLIKPEKDLPEEADRLDKVRKAAEALRTAKESPVSEESARVLADVEKALYDQITALGGTTAERKQREKAEQTVVELTQRAADARAKLVTIRGIEVDSNAQEVMTQPSAA